MRDFNLRFFRDRWPDDIFDLNELDSLDILKGIGGNYVIGALDGTQFVYPWGASPVYYIGLSQNLRQPVANSAWPKTVRKPLGTEVT